MMKNKKKWLALCCLMLLLCTLTACRASGKQNTISAGSEGSEKLPVLSDFAEKRIAVMEGTIQEDMIRAQFPNADVHVFNAGPDMPLALESGVVDAFVADAYIVSDMVKNRPSLLVLQPPVGSVEAAIAFPKTKEGAALRDQMNAFLKKCREDGIMKEMTDLWFSDQAADARVDRSLLPETGPVLNFATTGTAIPFSFFENGEVQGFDIDLAVRFCREYGYRLHIETMTFSSLIPALLSGKYDLSGNGIFVTEERRESVYFSDVYTSLDILFVTEKPDLPPETEGFLEGIADDFEKTFLREERWKLIAEGIWTTVYISVSAAVLGTVLGFGLCMLRRMRSRVVHGITTAYIRILEGTPQLVLLMILFYLIFANTDIPGAWVAVISFALNFAAYCCEILRVGIEAVDIGQTEAALALGYTKKQAFFRVVMPQVIANVLPVYQGELISLVKLTSIVGYIAVQDLTKMSDIIRSRTYQAFFPLITTAILYFLISWLLTALLKAVRSRFVPNREKRRLKGVRPQP